MSPSSRSPRTMFAPYTRLFAVPGARAFSFVGWIARLPLPMIGLGAVLLVEGETGSYGLAGAVAGVLALSGAVGQPAWARVADRRGQSAILRLSMVLFLLAGLAFTAVVVLDGPRWSWFVLAAVVGGSMPPIGSMIRARWAHALDSAGRQTAFAFESVVDEVVFVVGPPLVTLLATLVSPPTGFLTGVLFGVGGGWLLSGLRATEPPVHEPEAGSGSRWAAVLSPAVLVVSAAYLALGVVFGSMDVVVVAFAESEGAPALAGLALSVYAGGSLVAGLVYGLVRLPGTLAARFVACAVFVGVAAQGVLLVESLAHLVVAVFLAGLAIAPVLVSGTSLVETRVRRSSLTEALAWTTTGLTLGVTAGSALAGAAVDAWGAQAAFLVPSLGAGLAGLLGLAGAPLLRRPTADGEAVRGDAVPGPAEQEIR